MTPKPQKQEKWEKEFDEEFPPFEGIGAPFPIFRKRGRKNGRRF
jgi:hypothetical protein